MEECWQCPSKFQTRRELKNHMMPIHGTMRVICPWCPEERTYKRVTELRTHARNAHQHQLSKYPSDLISETNSVWFSLDPDGYSRLVQTSEWGCVAATHARVLVLEWLSRARKLTKKKDDWQRGWDGLKRKIVLTTQQHSPTPEAAFQPDYEEEIGTPASPAICYTPTAPNIEELEVLHVSLLTGSIATFIKQGGLKYEVSLRDSILQDPRGMASLSRKMAVQKLTAPFEIDPSRVKGITSSTVRERLIKFVGVDSVHIKEVKVHFEVTKSPPRKRMRSVTPTPPLRPRSPVAAQTAPPEQEPVQPTRKSLQRSTLSKRPTSLSERALSLLKSGCLPLFPPARRDWGDEEVSLRVENVTISWPPKQWKEMSQDRRLLSWEYTSMMLQQSLDSSTSSKIERIDLLDKFNFLALPGTVEKTVKKDDKIRRKTRYYIYEQLKNIVQENDGDEVWLRMIERSCVMRDRTTDTLLAVVEAGNIPVRL